MTHPADAGESMQAEFDTLAEWTAEVAVGLGMDFHLPAACRGSGNPGVLHWLLDRLGVGAGTQMLDCGAGVGGPAAFAAAETGVQPILSELQPGACRAARRLFDLPVVQAGSTLPFRPESFDVVWSLGVLCTLPDQEHYTAELRRVLRPNGRIGLLVFVAATPELSEQPDGNHFPTERGLAALLDQARLVAETSASAADFAAAPALWRERSETVEAELIRRHAEDPAWQLAGRQAEVIGRLLASGEVVGTMVVARPV